MKRYIFLILIFLAYGSFQSFSQFVMEGRVKNYGKIKKVYLYDYYSDRYHLIDTTDILKGKFKFKINGKNTFKLLKLRFTPDHAVNNIIFYNENIFLETDLKPHKTTINFIKSNENLIYQNYRQLTHQTNQKEKAIRFLQGFYKQDDEFYKTLQTEMLRIKSETQKNIDSLINNNKNYIASRIIKYEQIPLQKPNSKENISEFLRKHYWDNIDFSDTILIHLPLFAKKINDFFTLFEIPNINRETQEKLFQYPTDIVLSKSAINKIVFKSALNKLLNDSYDFGLRDLYNHIVDKYLEEDTIFSKKKLAEIRKKYKKNISLTINSKVPNIKITDKFSLYDIKKKNILLVFWESDCIYCFNTLNDLKAVYDSLRTKDFEVVAVSLDTDPNKFKRSILERGYNWINSCDFKGWFSDAAKKYDVTSTPTMFLLNKDKRIISKPLTIKQLLLKLKE